MSVQGLEILKGYITCEDPATRNKFFNLLDSFWHKADGKVLKEVQTLQDGTKNFIFKKQDDTTEVVSIPALPNTKPQSFITGLEEALGNRVVIVPGKGLSTNDLTAELYQKLVNLQNYVHPDYHQISEIENLPEQLTDIVTALENKQPIAPEGWGFSQQNYSSEEKEKLALLNEAHYAAPVEDLTALAAIGANARSNGQRRFVSGEGVDYFFDSNLLAADTYEADVAPDDQEDNTGFWVKKSITSVAIQDENGIEKFKFDRNLKFKGVNFNTAQQTIEIIKKLKEVVVQDKSQLLGDLQSDVLYVIDGYFALGDGETITVPQGGLNIMGYSFEASNISSYGVANHTIFDSPAEGSGNLIVHNIGFTTTGAGSKVFDIVDSDGSHAVEMVTVNFEGCQSIGKIRNYRQGTGITIGFYGCKDGLILSGTWNGFKLTNTNCFGFAATGTLFKKDVDTVFSNRLFLELNIDLPSGAKLIDFDQSNFEVNDLLQFNSTILKYNGEIDDTNAAIAIPNIRANNPKCLWRSNVGIPDTAIEKFVDAEVVDNFAIDWLNDTFNIVMTGDTTFTDENLPASGKSTKEIQIYLSGNFVPTFPAGWNANKVGTYKQGELNKITLKFIKAGIYFMKIDNSLTVYPAPDLEPYDITYIPPMEQKVIPIIGSFFTPQSVVEIDRTTVNDTVFVNSSRIDVTVTAGASEGNGSLRITNGTLRSFSNFVEIIDGEVFYFDESNVLSNTGLTIQDGNFSGIGTAELLSIQTNERTYITTDQTNGINKSGDLDTYINFRRLDGSLFLRLDNNGNITKPDGTILNKSIKGRRIDINNGQINFIEGGGGYAHYQSYSEELIMEIEKNSDRSISMGMKAKVYVIPEV